MVYEIVIVCNDSYVQHAAVMLCSLFDTNKGKRFHINLLTDGLTEANKSALEAFCKEHGSTLSVTIPDSSYNGIELSSLPVGQWHTMMYYKLFIPRIMPSTLDRCLFLDVDMVVCDDISALYNQDISDFTIFAAADTPDALLHKKRLGLEKDAIYINSGVMLCNLERWRKMESERPIIQFTYGIRDRIVNEQDVIACYFQGEFRIMPIRWNMVTFYFWRYPNIDQRYLPQLKDARRNPGIVHFASPVKPWYRDSYHPYAHLYRRYLRKTPWKDAPGFGYYEKLTRFGRFKKLVRRTLNRFDIMHDVMYLVK